MTGNIGYGFAQQRKLLFSRILNCIEENSGKDLKIVMAIITLDVGCSEKILKETIGNMILAGRVEIKGGLIHAVKAKQ